MIAAEKKRIKTKIEQKEKKKCIHRYVTLAVLCSVFCILNTSDVLVYLQPIFLSSTRV